MRTELFQRIDGGEKLTAIFGVWPSFHDGIVEMVALKPGGSVEVTFTIFRMTAELDAKGHYICDRYTRTRFRFGRCEDVRLISSYAGAIVSGLVVEEAQLLHPRGTGFRVEVDSCTDFELELTCALVEVIDAVPVPALSNRPDR